MSYISSVDLCGLWGLQGGFKGDIKGDFLEDIYCDFEGDIN